MLAYSNHDGGAMSLTEVFGGHLPRLPELDKKDIEAVRRSLPGKILGRGSALLSVALVFLVLVAAASRELKYLLDSDLLPKPLLGLLVGLLVLVPVWQLLVEGRAERARRALQRLAIRLGVEQSGYFRIGPYLDSPEDRVQFARADRAHEKVLNWIEQTTRVPLYLTGDSGSGKSSLLNASVVPGLRERGWTVVEIRIWQNPEAALRAALAQLPGARRPRQGEKQALRGLMEAAARRASERLLLVLDQFEEFVILGKPEQQREFAALIADLQAISVKGLSLLLVLRSDYQTFLEDIGLPLLRYGENLYQVRRFTIAAASNFFARSGLDLQPAAVDRLLNSAAELDETPGLVRPITLNVIGYVLADGKAVAPSLDAGQLVRGYIEQTVDQPAIRDFAPRVLEQLLTEQGTKRPRSEQELAAVAHLRRGEVRAVLNGLGAAALARPLDPAQGVWELSHDFIARAVARYLGRRRRDLLRRSVFYAAPALLAATLLVAAGVITSTRSSLYQIPSELAELGLNVASGGLVVEASPRLTSETFRAGPLLAQLTKLQTLVLRGAAVENLEPLKGLTALQKLDLTGSAVENLEPLKGLTALGLLDLTGTRVKDLEPLKDLSRLQTLVLSGTAVENLESLKHLTTLRFLNLTGTRVENLEPLKDLIGLQTLVLNSTRVENLEPLKGLTAVRYLDLTYTKVRNLDALRGLTALQTLVLTGTAVENFEPLKSLTALQELYCNGTRVGNLEPLADLTKLQKLLVEGTALENLEPLKGLTALQMLDLNGTRVENLAPLKGLTELRWLLLSSTAVENLEPLKNLTKLQKLDLNKTTVGNLEPLGGLPALQAIALNGTRVENLEPLKGLAALQLLDLVGTKVRNLDPLKGLPSLQSLTLSGTLPEAERTIFNRYREGRNLQPVRIFP